MLSGVNIRTLRYHYSTQNNQFENQIYMKRITLSAAAMLFTLAMFAQAPSGAPAGAPARPSGPRQADVIPGRTAVSPTLEDYFTPATAEAALPDEEGFIRRWLLLEPIAKPNRSNTVFTDSYVRENLCKEYFKGQLTELPKDGQKLKVVVDVTPAPMGFVFPGQEPQKIEPKFEKRTLKWHALDSKLFNVKLFRFAAGLKTDVYGVIFYGCTVIDCPEAVENVRLATGTNGASMWWVNGEEAVIMSSDRRMVQDDCMSQRLTLNKGRNVIWFAVINGPGMSDMCARFVDENGKPVTSFTINTK